MRTLVPWTPTIHLALENGPPPGSRLTDEELREAWAEYGERVLDLAGQPARCWAWWRFSPVVPRGLRGDRPAFTEVGSDAERRAARDEHDLAERRRMWLRERRVAATA